MMMMMTVGNEMVNEKTIFDVVVHVGRASDQA